VSETTDTEDVLYILAGTFTTASKADARREAVWYTYRKMGLYDR